MMSEKNRTPLYDRVDAVIEMKKKKLEDLSKRRKAEKDESNRKKEFLDDEEIIRLNEIKSKETS